MVRNQSMSSLFARGTGSDCCKLPLVTTEEEKEVSVSLQITAPAMWELDAKFSIKKGTKSSTEGFFEYEGINVKNN